MSRLIKQIFCGHSYKLINQYESKSKWDLVVANGWNPNTHTSTKRMIITDYKCEHCDKLKRLTIKIS